jgi:DNA anti-recombination protein RmuC
MSTTEQVQDWKKRVDESQGTLAYLPEEFKEAADKLEAGRVAFNEQIKAMAEAEIKLRVEQENLILSIRQELSKSQPDIWVKDVALVGEALKDGLHIIHIVEQKPRGF